MKIWPDSAEAWQSAVLFILTVCLFLSMLLCTVAIQYAPASRYSLDDSFVEWIFVRESMLICSMLFAFALFLYSQLLALWERTKESRWAVFWLGIYVVIFILYLLPRFTVAREKPLIYLYPTVEQQVNVKLKYDGALIHSYPEYPETGWQVLAKPSGDLTEVRTGRHHYCLFWEGEDSFDYKSDEGFVVAGKDTAAFLESTLSALGLSEREANEFIIYWLPRMEKNPWNLVTFPSEEYCRHARLDVTPVPDTMIRVFMVFKAIDGPIDIRPQKPRAATRHGFTVVEWGGTEVQ
jgi:hypothetical protein